MPGGKGNIKPGDNPKPFQKGADERRNTQGRPKKLPELDVLMADLLGDEQKGGKTAAAIILDALYEKAKKGDIRASEVLLNRGYGLPTQKHLVQGDKDNPIIFKTDERFLNDGS